MNSQMAITQLKLECKGTLDRLLSRQNNKKRTAEDGDGNVGETIRLITEDFNCGRLITEDKMHT